MGYYAVYDLPDTGGKHYGNDDKRSPVRRLEDGIDAKQYAHKQNKAEGQIDQHYDHRPYKF